MTLLDDAREIQRLGPPDYDGIDLCCQRVQASQDHAPHCPWLSLPRIVAVLEAAEEIAEWYADYGARSPAFDKLVAALTGEKMAQSPQES